jgi:hypothetical protein
MLAELKKQLTLPENYANTILPGSANWCMPSNGSDSIKMLFAEKQNSRCLANILNLKGRITSYDVHWQ